MAASVVASVLRIVSDNHYTTDVLLGAGVGLLSGYALPQWLHYGASGELATGWLPTSPGILDSSPAISWRRSPTPSKHWRLDAQQHPGP